MSILIIWEEIKPLLYSAGNYSGVIPLFCFVFEILRGKRQKSQSNTKEKGLTLLWGFKTGFDFPGVINYEVFLFLVISKNEEIKLKQGLLDP